MVTPLEQIFPGLARASYRVTSPYDPDYNCIAWAAGDTGNWWWPGPDLEREHWPAGVPREPTLQAFQAAFATIGYVACDSEEWESGFEKVALFGDDQGKPRHAARQSANGRWTSKLGRGEDIEHGLHDVAGQIYGSVLLVMKRPVAASGQEAGNQGVLST
jgi:hypothetical protein